MSFKPNARSRATIRTLILAAGVVAGPLANAQDAYPERPITIIVPFAPGGPTDIMTRFVADPLGEALGQSIVVENRPGAGGNIGIGGAARAEPDGYTLLVTYSAFVVNPSLYASVPYDPFEDFEPIAMLGSSPNIFLAHPGAGIESIEQLIEKAEGGALNYASPGAGTTPHLSGELLKLQAEVDITHVPFNGAGPAIQGVLANTTQLASTALPPSQAHVESGALKALAVTGRERWPSMPDVPTMVELGYEDFVSETFQAFMAPAGTPPEIVERLSSEVIKVLEDPALLERLAAAGFGVLANGPDELRAQVEAEVPMWRTVIEESGIEKIN